MMVEEKRGGKPKKAKKVTGSKKPQRVSITPEELKLLAVEKGFDFAMQDGAKGVDIIFTQTGLSITPRDHDRHHDKGGDGGSYDKDVSH